MKKIILSVLCLLTAVLLSACGGSDGAEDSYVNGTPLSEYTIVYSDNDGGYSKRAAEYLKEEIFKRTETELSLVKDTEAAAAEHEIVVGETSREISGRLDPDTEKTRFAILAEGGSVALEADYFVIAAAAYFFIETYVPTDNFTAEIPNRVCLYEPITKEADNFILLIGDGMGLYQTLLFDILENDESYSDGEDIFYGYLLPCFGLARTRSLDGTTDSAAAGTALSCGVKTKNSYVGKDENYNDLRSITELAASLGKATAVMSTESSTGATPAAFSSHVNNRGQSEEILADQNELKNSCKTLINCDYNYYDEEGVALIESNISSTLETLSENENGFFLMYEEAHIDKFCHSGDKDGAFRALLRFNQAIALFMEYAFYHPDTMVLITADHETGKLLPSGSGGYSFNTTAHSSYYVPVFSFGDGSELFDGVIIENIQIPQTIASFMGVDDFGDQSAYSRLNVNKNLQN